MSLAFKRTLNWAGRIIAVGGIIFVVLRFKAYSNEINFLAFGTAAWLVLLGLTLIYSVSNILLALSWRAFLFKFNSEISLFQAIKIYGITQISKYVPGNIFHLAGRQTMGMAAGIPGWALVKSSVWELGLISATGGLFAALVVPVFIPEVNIFLAVVLFASIAVIAGLALYRFSGYHAAFAFCLYLLFLVISGLIFLFLIIFFFDIAGGSLTIWLLIVASYIIAWFAGLVTPGAPAGIGIRELVLLFLLKGIIAESDLLMAVLLGRVVTVCGDFLFFIFSLKIKKV